jgi:hypothetical protein
MQKITKSCGSCKKSFTITYYAAVSDEDATDVCPRCWDKQVRNYYTSSRDVLKGNPVSIKPAPSTKVYDVDPMEKLLGNLKPSELSGKLKNVKPSSRARRKKEKEDRKRVTVSRGESPWVGHLSPSKASSGPSLSEQQSKQLDKLIESLKASGV